jgi:hypothetical protein
MMAEAKMARNENGLAPEGEGWFVLNAREARWLRHETFGTGCRFEGKEPFPEMGIVLRVLMPVSRTACITARTRRRTSWC